MASANRKVRLESFLKREIATCIQQELRDPRLGFITVTRVEATPDLHKVTAFYTVYGNATQRNLAANALASARGFIQRQYAPHVQMRLIPQLSFSYDEMEDKRQRMNDLIAQARASDPDEPSGESQETD